MISLLNEPNTFSPANVDASVMYRRWRDSRGKDKEYENIIRKQVCTFLFVEKNWPFHVPNSHLFSGVKLRREKVTFRQ